MPYLEEQTRQTIKVVQNAFQPLKCKAEDYDFQDKIRFTVWIDDETTIKGQATIDSMLRDLNQWRATVLIEARKKRPDFEYDDRDFVV